MTNSVFLDSRPQEELQCAGPQYGRAEQILNVLIEQTGQVEYDPATVEQLISEYERLIA